MREATALGLRLKLTEWYAAVGWPLHRRWVGRHLTPRCVRCALSSACAPLDAQGSCSACRASDEGAPAAATAVTPEHERALDEVLRGHQGAGQGAYDALVLFSGGKDSAFLIWELKRRYPRLRLLAFLVDNGFMSPVALENAAHAARRLDVDYVPFRPAPSFFQRYFRAACLAAGPGRGCFQTVDMTDLYFFFSIARTWAARNGIPLIIDGLAWAQTEHLYGQPGFEMPRDLELRRAEEILEPVLSQTRVDSDRDSFWRPEAFDAARHARLLHPFWVWRHEEQEIRRRVTELGLLKRGNDSPLLTNSPIIVMMTLVDYVRLGYGSYEPDITAQVRSGTADRRYWQALFEISEYVAKTGWVMKQEISTVAQSLGLTTRQLGLTW